MYDAYIKDRSHTDGVIGEKGENVPFCLCISRTGDSSCFVFLVLLFFYSTSMRSTGAGSKRSLIPSHLSYFINPRSSPLVIISILSFRPSILDFIIPFSFFLFLFAVLFRAPGLHGYLFLFLVFFLFKSRLSFSFPSRLSSISLASESVTPF